MNNQLTQIKDAYLEAHLQRTFGTKLFKLQTENKVTELKRKVSNQSVEFATSTVDDLLSINKTLSKMSIQNNILNKLTDSEQITFLQEHYNNDNIISLFLQDKDQESNINDIIKTNTEGINKTIKSLEESNTSESSQQIEK